MILKIGRRSRRRETELSRQSRRPADDGKRCTAAERCVSEFQDDIEDWEEVQEEGDSRVAPKLLQNPRPADDGKRLEAG